MTGLPTRSEKAGKGAEGEQKRPRFFAFWNSRIGLTLASILLTGILIPSVQFAWNKFDEQRRDQLAAAQQEDELIKSVRELIDGALAARVANTDLMIQAVDEQVTPPELGHLRIEYWSSYRNYFISNIRNELNLQREFGAEPLPSIPRPMQKALGDRGESAFWYYVDDIINPSLDQVHRCVIKAQGDLVLQKTSATSDAVQIKKSLRSCINGMLRNGRIKAKWVDFRPKLNAYCGGWCKLKICISTFVLDIDYSVRIREQVTRQGRPPLTWDEMKTAGDMKFCPESDARCRQYRFNRDLLRSMSQDCGSLT